jgi:hypothetical protein
MNEDDIKIDDPDEKDEEIIDDEEENDDEEKDDQDESDEDKDSSKEEDLTLARVDYGQIKEKYPTFFKDFPELKHAFFREQQFTEIFPTIEDAKRAAERELAYEEISSAVIEGDAGKFISELGSENKESLVQFAKNFIPALQKQDKDIFYEAIGPTLQGFVKNVYHHGVKEGDDNIKNAAKIVHKMLFGGGYDDVEKSGDFEIRSDRREDKVSKEKESFMAEKYNRLYGEVTNSCYSSLESEIVKGLDDLKKTQPGLYKIITKDIKERVLSDMDKDQAYLGRMASLWKREQRAGFNGSLKNSLQTAFIAKAKTLVPKYRSEVRREVLGKEKINGNNEEKREPNRLTGDRDSKSSGKGKMTPERQRTEKLTTRQVFDA